MARHPPVPIRCLLIGKRRSAFRILHHVANDEVRILAIRRPAQDLMGPEELYAYLSFCVYDSKVKNNADLIRILTLFDQFC